MRRMREASTILAGFLLIQDPPQMLRGKPVTRSPSRAAHMNRLRPSKTK
jgi:hypothetical protein